MTAANWLEEVRFGTDGLVPVVAQERLSGDVLMLAWASREALEQTLLSGRAHYYSRSRQTLWRKGETSGHEQRVVEIRLDCDGDAVLYRVEQTGPACHTGTRTCFSKAVRRDASPQDESIRPVEEEDPGGHQLSPDRQPGAESSAGFLHGLAAGTGPRQDLAEGRRRGS